jgi:hypothetical protein
MKKIFLIAFMLLVFAFQSLNIAQTRKFGLGVIIGAPTGLSAKLWVSRTNALDFGLGWSVQGYRFYAYDSYYYKINHTHFHIDYLWHSFNAFNSNGQFPLYYGVGMSLDTAPDYNSAFGIRGVLGVAWTPRTAPIDIFFEVAPSFIAINPAGFIIDAGIGARFYF